MLYMYLVIVRGAFNASYGNNTMCIYLSIQDNVINAIIEVSDWSITETCFLSG